MQHFLLSIIILIEALPVAGIWKKYKSTGKRWNLWDEDYPWKTENRKIENNVIDEDYDAWFQRMEKYMKDLGDGKYRFFDQHLSVILGDNGVIYYDDGTDYGDYYEQFDNELK
ncbi:unnamed protein product [Cylicocyclus nassatus]|uniref:Uncharacterized protein n=1 Tax=Cylicocyclus nassatus TaxID=53992 RepID=A0AA36M9H2_CYLNA|nr:unnamed protein product [Cylicocyclus nassatus]